MTQTALLPIPGAPKILVTYAFDERDDGGTHFEFRVAKPKPKDLPFYEQVWPTVQKNYDVGLEILRSMLEERAEAAQTADEPSLPSPARTVPDSAVPSGASAAAESEPALRVAFAIVPVINVADSGRKYRCRRRRDPNLGLA